MSVLGDRPQARRRAFGILTFAGAVLLLFGIAEGMATLYFAGDRNGFESARLRLAGITHDESALLTGQPYLLYVPTPGFKRVLQSDSGPIVDYHNAQGYRGRAVPMERRPSVARVLCLGGSTTYGSGTRDADSAYPAQLEQILNATPLAGFTGAEVINGGLPAGTSAELLTHYHFKFHYFRPDVVVINTGGNDIGAIFGWGGAHDPSAEGVYYQPDYSTWRHPLQVPQPLPGLGRTLLRSRVAAWFVIRALLGQTPGNTALQRPADTPPNTVWHPAAETPGRATSISDEQLAFTHNLTSLIEEIRRDGANVVLVPFRLAPKLEDDVYTDGELAEIARNERILVSLGRDPGVVVAPFPHDAISSENWVDDCHLNSPGCREKAEHIAPYVRRALSRDVSRLRAP